MVTILPPKTNLGSQIGQSVGRGIAGGMEQSLSKQAELLGVANREREYIARGMDPNLARLAAVAPVGGQTEMFRVAADQLKRAPEGPIDRDAGLTPAERVRVQGERYKTGLPEFNSSVEFLQGAAENKRRFDILDSLNESKKLPKDLGRLNVDKEGNLKFRFLATPESQRFEKTLNELSNGAKGTFGARVTNFDLTQYMKQFPSLLNTEEGRRQVISQLKIINEINSVYHKNLRQVVKEAGGLRRIDMDEAKDLAEEKSAPIIENLSKKFDSIGKMPSLPDARLHEGKKIKDEETGEVLTSDGRNWIPVRK